MSKLENYKGTKDYYPEDMLLRNYIFSIWDRVCKSFGYSEYNASILEYFEVYSDKTSIEILKEQTYNFTDRGGRDVILRPEMTPTVARMIAKKSQTLAFPLRWYSIANCFRYERPQKGRKREFWQLNVDTFGFADDHLEIEIIELVNQLMKAFGATTKQYTISINNRGLINYLLSKLFNVNPEDRDKLMNIIDKKKKTEEHKFKKLLAEIIDVNQIDILNELLSINKISNLEVFFAKHNLSIDNSSLISLKGLIDKTDKLNCKLDLGLMRGFGYYTGNVFEVFDNNSSNNRSMFGGGRYDNLLTQYNSSRQINSFGFGMGDEVLSIFLDENGLLPDLNDSIDVYVAISDPLNYDIANRKVNDLRNKSSKNVVFDCFEQSKKKAYLRSQKLNSKEFIYI